MALWHDSVWSQVIAAGILTLIAAIWAAIKLRLRQRLSALWLPNLTVTRRYTTWNPGPGIGHPLKYYAEMRNDSSKCIEVALVKFDELKISFRSFPTEALQIRFNTKWSPEQFSVDRVALLPGQM